jgi:hypothetical protein
MRKLALFAVASLLTLGTHEALARVCNFVKGEDRWEVKTSVPDGALNQTPREISLEAFMDTQNPPLTAKQKQALADRRWAGRVIIADKDDNNMTLREGSMISVEGFLYRARCQKDGDFHLEIGTVNRKGAAHCLIVEVPDPGQVKNNADLKARVTEVREKLDQLPSGIFTGKGNFRPVDVKITGQLFLDAHHIQRNDPGGRRGTRHCATNAWEIHPVTGLELIGR